LNLNGDDDSVKSSDVFLHGKDSKTKDWTPSPSNFIKKKSHPPALLCPSRELSVNAGMAVTHPPAQTGPLGCVVPPNAYGNLIETRREKPN